MTNREESSSIPAELLENVKAIVDILHEERPELKDDVIVLAPSSRGAIGGGVGEAILFVAAGSLGWVTKKWLDEFLWPKLKKVIEAPSQRALEIVFGKVDSSPGAKHE